MDETEDFLDGDLPQKQAIEAELREVRRELWRLVRKGDGMAKLGALKELRQWAKEEEQVADEYEIVNAEDKKPSNILKIAEAV